MSKVRKWAQGGLNFAYRWVRMPSFKPYAVYILLVKTMNDIIQGEGFESSFSCLEFVYPINPRMAW